MRSVTAIAALALAVAIGACGEPGVGEPGRGANGDGRADGLWLLTLLEVDGATIPVDEPLFLEIDGEEVGGDTVCNGFGGTFTGDFVSELAGCGAEIERVQDLMIEAILAGPERVDGDLVFASPDASVSGSARLVYQAVEDLSASQLFGVLDDEARTASTDEIFLDPEAGSHPDYHRLVGLRHGGTEARFFIGLDGELVCFVRSTDAAASTQCQPPRRLQRWSWGLELADRNGPVGVRAALIPDHMVGAVADRPDLGQLDGNVLLLAEDVQPGLHAIDGRDGLAFTLQVVG